MAEPIISVSGLRGIIGESLTPEIAIRYVTAFAATSAGGRILIGRDGRSSGAMLADAVRAGLQAVGCSTIEGGILATPTVGILVRQFQAAGGIQITASHNPSAYNGLKLFTAEGRVISSAAGQEVLDRYRSASPPWVPFDRLGSGSACDDPFSAHLQAVLATIDVQRVRQCGFKVLLDSNHGAGSQLGRRLLAELGCEVTLLGAEPDGRFDHTPEPTAENLVGVPGAVRQVGADVGFCQDPDADRLALIDKSGRYVGEEYTLALCVDHVLGQRKGPIVTNCSSSRMSEDIARRHGAGLVRAAVGEANVVDAMLAHDAVFGGEGNGGPIDPRVGLVRDSFVGMALILDAMAARQLPVGVLCDALPRYEIVKTKISLPRENVAAGLDALERHFAGARPDRLDGLRLDWPQAWLLVRGSNTEPVVRAVAEAPTASEARRLCEEAAEVLYGVQPHGRPQ